MNGKQAKRARRAVRGVNPKMGKHLYKKIKRLITRGDMK